MDGWMDGSGSPNLREKLEVGNIIHTSQNLIREISSFHCP